LASFGRPIKGGTEDDSKDHLFLLAQSYLPGCMGDKYAQIVETCLTCLEPDVDFGNGREFVDEDGIRVGTRYIEKVSVVVNLAVGHVLILRRSYFV
jgi:hypothetical protein